LKIFLNITAEVEKYDEKLKQCFLKFNENPFADFVILPNFLEKSQVFWYSNVLCGMVKGALESIGIIVEA